VPVTGISTATALALGSDHTCALLVSGEVECWGAGSYGQLGHGLYQSSYIPISVIGISTAVAISAAADQTCAVLRSGSVQCWGQNFYGELGNGTKANSNTPVTVTGISSATAVANADLSTCALLASGAVKCWGYDGDGELGDGTNAHDSTIPVTVTGISTAVAIAGGSDHYCAVLRTGSVKCWGQNAYGELGDGTNIPLSDTPVRVRAINSPTRLAAGDQHTCALFSGGLMRCWGWNSSGQLGNREKTNSPNPSPVTVVGTPGVVWESSNLTIATITDRGIATARAAGNTAISATTAGFINDNAVLTVK
jgi:alpha-tubulin suppressor-like RCC1 family protein